MLSTSTAGNSATSAHFVKKSGEYLEILYVSLSTGYSQRRRALQGSIQTRPGRHRSSETGTIAFLTSLRGYV